MGFYLKTLTLKDFAIVDQLSLPLREGFNALTGETGAGKSILIDALSLALGERASLEAIREGRERAQVDALFLWEGPGRPEEPLLALLEPFGWDEEEGQLVLTRILSRSGKSQGYLNGHPAPARILRDVGRHLVAIHSQHQTQELFSPSLQLELLDAFLDAHGRERRREVKETYEKWREANRSLAELAGDPRERARREDLLRFEVAEIEAARLHPGEERELEERRQVMIHRARLGEAVAQAQALLQGDGGGGGLVDGGGRLWELLAQGQRWDGSLSPLVDLAKEAHALWVELSHQLRNYEDELSFSDEDLQALEERWDLLQRLRRKYGDSAEAILRYGDKARRELQALEEAAEKAAFWEEEGERQKAGWQEAARALSRFREEAAEKLARRVEDELQDLGFPQGSFRVRCRSLGAQEPSPTGQDEVEYLFSPNPGQSPQPLREIASGGELSRVMLALRAVFAADEKTPIVIFDEIDAGVAGRMAHRVGEKLREIAAGRQVLCITHLPQIAARADWQVAIEKISQDQEVQVLLRPVEGYERLKEIARMLAGTEDETALAHARQLLQEVQP
ncbi:MAG: DNA repair protein RecN [Bacillota bacterium]|nr:DNA repair protein RecN [Bacillota bacterium]